MKGFQRTSPNSARAVRAYSINPNELLKKVEEAVENLPRWTLKGREGTELQAVRKSRLFRFEDDVTVEASVRGAGSDAVFESASRVGKGDLGQNVRNLRDLIESLDRLLG